MTGGVAIRTFPHKPDGESLSALRGRLQQFIAQVKSVREREARHRNGEFFGIVGEEWLRLASLLYLEEQPPPKVVDCVRHGLADLTLSYELGHDVEPPTIARHFGAALVAGDRGSARFLATLPREVWGFPTKPEGTIDSWIVRTLFTLYLGETDETAIALEFLEGLIFEEEIPQEVAGRKKEFETWHRILKALVAKDGKVLGDQLLIREEWRAAALKEEVGSEALELIDWAGLALCRMSQEAGLRVEVTDVYLPLDLLRVPLPAVAT